MGLYNIPLEHYGAKVSIEKFPEKVVAKTTGENTIHIVPCFDDGGSDFSLAMCGRMTREEVLFPDAPRSQFCIPCLDKLDDFMEGHMYDEQNEVYYDPREENV